MPPFDIPKPPTVRIGVDPFTGDRVSRHNDPYWQAQVAATEQERLARRQRGESDVGKVDLPPDFGRGCQFCFWGTLRKPHLDVYCEHECLNGHKKEPGKVCPHHVHIGSQRYPSECSKLPEEAWAERDRLREVRDSQPATTERFEIGLCTYCAFGIAPRIIFRPGERECLKGVQKNSALYCEHGAPLDENTLAERRMLIAKRLAAENGSR